MRTDTLFKYKGLADILTALILSVKPNLIYQSAPVRALAAWSGLHLSAPEAASGFNQAIACMCAAVGVGHVVAARSIPATRPTIISINLTWSLLSFLTCLTPRAWDLGSATLLLTAINHAVFSLAFYISDRRDWEKRDE